MIFPVSGESRAISDGREERVLVVANPEVLVSKELYIQSLRANKIALHPLSSLPEP